MNAGVNSCAPRGAATRTKNEGEEARGSEGDGQQTSAAGAAGTMTYRRRSERVLLLAHSRIFFFSQPSTVFTHSSPGLRQSLDMNGILDQAGEDDAGRRRQRRRRGGGENDGLERHRDGAPRRVRGRRMYGARPLRLAEQLGSFSASRSARAERAWLCFSDVTAHQLRPAAAPACRRRRAPTRFRVERNRVRMCRMCQRTDSFLIRREEERIRRWESLSLPSRQVRPALDGKSERDTARGLRRSRTRDARRCPI